mmetsp:Transcript_10437/g.43153  ORF Transcript_10437/g.43153 Transcript_10437/m.43153 type:complete len:299 (+) Transcript_10437:1855-2751(+)
MVGDDLHNAEPDVIAHELSGLLHELKGHIAVPLEVRRELLCQNCQLEGELLANGEVGRRQVRQQLAGDRPRVGLVAHAVEHVQRPPANGDVRVAQGVDDLLLVHLDVFQHLGHEAEPAHRLETEVAHVGLRALEEFAQQVDAQRHELRVQTKVDDQLNGLEEHAVQSVVLVPIAARGFAAHEHAAQHLVQAAILRVVLSRRKVLQHAHDLHLEPRRRDAVVRVVLRHVLPRDEPLEHARELGHAGRVLLEITLGVGHQCLHQRHERRQDAQVALVYLLDDLRNEAVHLHDVPIAAVQA